MSGITVRKHCESIAKSDEISRKDQRDHPISLWIYNVFRTRFPVLKKLSIPLGLLWFTDVGNHVLKTLWIHSEIWWNSMKFHEKQLRFIVNSNSFWTWFLFLKISSIPIGKVDILEVGNHVLETLVIQIEIWWNFMKLHKK